MNEGLAVEIQLKKFRAAATRDFEGDIFVTLPKDSYLRKLPFLVEVVSEDVRRAGGRGGGRVVRRGGGRAVSAWGESGPSTGWEKRWYRCGGVESRK